MGDAQIIAGHTIDGANSASPDVSIVDAFVGADIQLWDYEQLDVVPFTSRIVADPALGFAWFTSAPGNSVYIVGVYNDESLVSTIVRGPINMLGYAMTHATPGQFIHDVGAEHNINDDIYIGQLYHFISYGVDRKTHRLDFDQVARLAREHKPKLIVAGASAYPREIPHGKFAEIAREVGALLFVDMAHYAGLVAAGLHDNPVPVADFVTTTTHKTLRGPRSGMSMCKAAHAKDLDRSVFPGIQGGPLMHIVAAKAICFAEALKPDFKRYAQAIIDNARTLAETLTAGGLKLVSGGTDNHLMLVDVTAVGLSGKPAEAALGRAGITVNMNMIPYDERKPMDPSGIRVGTPALTTRGMGVAEMRTIGGWMLEVLKAPDDATVSNRVRAQMTELCGSFPVPAAELETV